MDLEFPRKGSEVESRHASLADPELSSLAFDELLELRVVDVVGDLAALNGLRTEIFEKHIKQPDLARHAEGYSEWRIRPRDCSCPRSRTRPDSSSISHPTATCQLFAPYCRLAP